MLERPCGCLHRRDPPQVNDSGGNSSVGPHLAQESIVVSGLSRPHRMSILSTTLVARPGDHRDHPATVPLQALRQTAPEPALVDEHQPAGAVVLEVVRRLEAGRGRFPERTVEPVRHVGFLARRRRRTRDGRQARVTRVDPVALPLEGVGGQGHAPAPLAGMEALPVDVRSGEPQAGERPEHHLVVRAALACAARGGDCDLLWPALLMLSRQAAERLAGPNLQKYEAAVPQQLGETLVEAHPIPQLSGPVAGIHRLRFLDPGAGEVGDVGDPGWVSLHARDQVAEGSEHRLHHRRMESM